MEERIKYLFRKYLNDACTKEEFEEVFLYLQNEGNQLLIRSELRKIYEETLQSQPSGVFVDEAGSLTGVPVEAVIESAAGPGDNKRRKKKRMLSLALVLLVLVTGGVILRKILQREPLLAQHTLPDGRKSTQATKRSEYKFLLLPDSTQVWLNAASTLEFGESFGKDNRKVVLTGEAFFDVKHADKMPFIIYTGRVSTEVLGTAFNIKAYPDLERIVVSVKRGKVKVNYGDQGAVMLSVGQQVSIGNKDHQVKEKKVSVEETDSWQAGNLDFDDYAVADIVSDLERVFNVKIRIGSPATGNLRVSTTLRRQDGVKKALEVLGELTETELVIENDGYLLK